MKNTIKILLSLALLSFAFAGCSDADELAKSYILARDGYTNIGKTNTSSECSRQCADKGYTQYGWDPDNNKCWCKK